MEGTNHITPEEQQLIDNLSVEELQEALLEKEQQQNPPEDQQQEAPEDQHQEIKVAEDSAGMETRLMSCHHGYYISKRYINYNSGFVVDLASASEAFIAALSS